MKQLYVVNHYVPFPQSEYGGIWNVIAENDNECFDLIVDSDDPDGYNQQYYNRLKENIVDAYKFALDQEEESRVVESFTT
jgi:hypothetical protein